MPPRALFLENVVSWSVLYSSLIIAILLWCTILIIYHVWRVGGTAGRIHVYQRVIEMLVESTSLYSVVIVVLVVFEARNEVAGVCIEDLAIAMRVRLLCFNFLLSNRNCVFSRESYLQFWLVVLQQGMHAQTTPGPKVRCRHFSSQLVQATRRTATGALNGPSPPAT